MAVIIALVSTVLIIIFFIGLYDIIEFTSKKFFDYQDKRYTVKKRLEVIEELLREKREEKENE